MICVASLRWRRPFYWRTGWRILVRQGLGRGRRVPAKCRAQSMTSPSLTTPKNRKLRRAAFARRPATSGVMAASGPSRSWSSSTCATRHVPALPGSTRPGSRSLVYRASHSLTWVSTASYSTLILSDNDRQRTIIQFYLQFFKHEYSVNFIRNF